MLRMAGRKCHTRPAVVQGISSLPAILRFSDFQLGACERLRDRKAYGKLSQTVHDAVGHFEAALLKTWDLAAKLST